MATLNPILKAFWKTKARNRVLHGGRSSSKSWDAAGMAIFLAQYCKLRFLCTRQFQNKITESVYTLLKIQIERFGLQDDFDILNNTIRHKKTGSEFLFYGLWRHIDEIKSLESIDICWIEEAHNLTESQWEVLEPTIRKEGSQFWIIFNPKFSTDFVYKRFVKNPPPDTIVQQINYTDNSFLSDTILKVIEAKKEEDYEEYEHIYLGVPRDDDDSAVIKRSWVMAAIDAHKNITPKSGVWNGPKTVGYDVADSGDDLNATTSMDGSIITGLDEWKAGEDELFESSQRTHRTAKQIGATLIGYDSIGVGAGTGSHLKNDGWKIARTFRFNAGAKVWKPKQKYKDTKLTNEEFFSNLKAQSWWLLADRFRNTFLAATKGREFAAEDMISISSEIDSKMLDKLIDELCTPKKDYDKQGKVKVESKEDLKKREIDSPNSADSTIIASVRGMFGRAMIKDVL